MALMLAFSLQIAKLAADGRKEQQDGPEEGAEDDGERDK